MIGDWTAVAVRARGLAARRLGRAGARSLARSGSLIEAIGSLSHTPYGRDIRPGMDLVSAERAVLTTLLWHLRVLAGWAPSRGLDRVRLLAAGFEIANVADHLASLEGGAKVPPHALGALATAWGRISRAASGEEVRRALSASVWGDPGGSDIPTVGVALQAAWARRVAFGVPEAWGWARTFAGFILARMLAAGIPRVPDRGIDRNLRLVLGGRWEVAAATGESAHGELWRAEARSWSQIEEQAMRMHVGRQLGPTAVVAAAGLLAVDAWRTRAALEVAARGGEAPTEVFDVVA